MAVVRFVPFILLLLPAISPAGEQQNERPAVFTYKTFANAFISGNFRVAYSLAEGEADDLVARKEELVRKGEKLYPMEEPLFMIVSENYTDGGTKVKIHGMQIVQAKSGEQMFKPPELHRQFVTLTLKGGSWQVSSFHDDLEKCCQ